MPNIVAKITNNDGTEQTFGPMDVTVSLAKEIVAALQEPEAARVETVEKQRIRDIEAAQLERNAEIEAANQARIELAAEGIDPDAPAQNEGEEV